MSSPNDETKPMAKGVVDQLMLDRLSSLEGSDVAQPALKELGGTSVLLSELSSSIETGLNADTVLKNRAMFGENIFPESPMDSYLDLLLGALNDTTLIVLLFAAIVSLIIGIITEGLAHGWIEGGAILIAVVLVSNIAAMNDYSKQLQFAELEKTSAEDEKCMVLRDGKDAIINPRELVPGDILILQAGDMIPADAIMIDNNIIMSSEASLTGEPEDMKKSANGNFNLYSSCLVSECNDNFKAVVTGTGTNSQWGKIKANLATVAVDTPLQEKLNDMTEMIGYIGIFFAVLTFVSLVISIWTRPEGGIAPNSTQIGSGFVKASILAFTIVVVAIPEGLPLAVTIALAYSTKEMYKDQCLIRVLAACETMGNATNICSDKTGTLTENRMTVVAGWFAGQFYNQDEFSNCKDKTSDTVKEIISENTSINRTALLVIPPTGGGLKAIGNKTEGALMMMALDWGYEYERVRNQKFKDGRDYVFAFNSSKKRSTAIITKDDGSVRVLVKGASEWVIKDCTHYSTSNGDKKPMDANKLNELNTCIEGMADSALRTLVVGHVDFPSIDALPSDWQTNPPDAANLVCDCIVGIQDPLRSDVKEAVRIAQEAGVIVRMVTGDNIRTAKAIAKDCGILKDGGLAVEGPVFRKYTPVEADEAILTLAVMARSAPDDKHLLVTRLNGKAIPKDQEEWEAMFAKYPEIKWDTHKDKILPGYREEWKSTRPSGGEVVGVTGDGTNDAPALKAADVGLAMGITGTKVAQGASDIVILDDRFGSIVKAISWGRSVFDNIRKFLQFQLTVNVVALLLVFTAAAAGFGQPLTAVQMLWVNLIMDTLGALALGTEKPTPALLKRRPYKRNASLVSRPMWRNIFAQSAYQLIILFVLLFAGADWFDVKDISTNPCFVYELAPAYKDVTTKWKLGGYEVTCVSFNEVCKGKGTDCINKYKINKLDGFVTDCLSCAEKNYEHGTIIFNAFIWCQIFNEYTARSILNDWNPFVDIFNNLMFIYVSIFSIACQVLIVELGGRFTSTSPLSAKAWIWSIIFGAFSILVGIGMRYITLWDSNEEDPSNFFGTPDVEEDDMITSLFKYLGLIEVDAGDDDEDDKAKTNVSNSNSKSGDVEFTAVNTSENKL